MCYAKDDYLFLVAAFYLESVDKKFNLIAAEIFPPCDEGTSTEFSSPIHVTPLFRSLAAGIPSPKFSESVSFPLEFLTSNNIVLETSEV